MRLTASGRLARPSLFVGALSFTALIVSSATQGSGPTSPSPNLNRERIESKLSRLPDAGQPLLQPSRPTHTVTGKQGPPQQTIQVKCALGQSVTDALSRATGNSVLIQISGTCQESVKVRRDNVTLSGEEAGGATIDPPDAGGLPAEPAVEASGVRGLTLRKLTLTGATEGLRAVRSWDLMLDEVTATGNSNGPIFGEGFGAYFEASDGVIQNSDLSGNEAPVVAWNHSRVNVFDSRIHGNTLDGPFSFRYSSLALVRCDIANNPLGPQAVDFSRTIVLDSTVANNVFSFASGFSDLRYFTSTITGSVDEDADRSSYLSFFNSTVETQYLFINRSSTLELAGSTFTAIGSEPDRGIQAFQDSFVRVGRRQGVPSDIDGNVFLGLFSNGVFNTDAPITGSATCTDRSGATFSQTPAGGETGCS